MTVYMLKVGIVGCGTIGSELAKAIQTRFSKVARVAFLFDLDPLAVQKLKLQLHLKAVRLSPRDLIRQSDLIIEAASQQAACEMVPVALRLRKKILVMSVGGILKLPPVMLTKSKGFLYIPSGAVAGIDGLLGARIGKLKRVTIVTRKPLKGFKSAPFFKIKKFPFEKIRHETVLFEGNVRTALRLFPQNVNVSATLSLAGIGPDKTKVKIITSPTLKRNIHEIFFEGEFGKTHVITENVPSKQNPKTSTLAFFSAIACLEKIFSPLKIGT